MDYIDPIIGKSSQKQRKQFKDIRTFYLWKFLEDHGKVENFVLQVIEENTEQIKSCNMKDFTEKLKAWIQAGEQKYDLLREMLYYLEKSNFSFNDVKENFKNFMHVLIMSSDEYAIFSQDIWKLKADKGLENICTTLEQQDSVEKLVKEFEKLEKLNFEKMDKIEKVFLRNFIDKQLENVTKFIDDIALQHPADILNEIIVSEQLKDNNLQQFLLLGKKVVFDHRKEYKCDKSGSVSRDKDFNMTDKKLFSQIFFSLKNLKLG